MNKIVVGLIFGALWVRSMARRRGLRRRYAHDDQHHGGFDI